jgi:hypothetical protein
VDTTSTTPSDAAPKKKKKKKNKTNKEADKKEEEKDSDDEDLSKKENKWKERIDFKNFPEITKSRFQDNSSKLRIIKDWEEKEGYRQT